MFSDKARRARRGMSGAFHTLHGDVEGKIPVLAMRCATGAPRGCGGHEACYFPLHWRLTPGCSERRQEGTGRGSRLVGTHTASKRGCEWRLRHRGRQLRRSGSASNRDRRREPLKRAPAHAGARGNEPRIPTKGTPWAEPGRFARGPRLILCSLGALAPYAGQRRLDQSQRYGHQMTVLIRFSGDRLVA